jgi:TolB-like protein
MKTISARSMMVITWLGLLAALARAAEPAPASAKGPTIAVLYLDYSGQDEELAQLRKGLAQMLVTDLSANPRLSLVERLQLEAVLAELKLGQTRQIDRQSAAKVGKLLGARYLVMGGYFELAGSLRVDVRVVDVETGALVKGFGVTGKGDDFLGLEQALVTGLDAILDGLSSGAALEGAPQDRTAKRLPKEKSGVGGKHGNARDGGVEPVGGEPAVKQRPQAPPRLRTKTAVRYGKALDLMDQGKKSEAKVELEQVLAEEPRFGLADHELQRLAQ